MQQQNNQLQQLIQTTSEELIKITKFEIFKEWKKQTNEIKEPLQEFKKEINEIIQSIEENELNKKENESYEEAITRNENKLDKIKEINERRIQILKYNLIKVEPHHKYNMT